MLYSEREREESFHLFVVVTWDLLCSSARKEQIYL